LFSCLLFSFASPELQKSLELPAAFPAGSLFFFYKWSLCSLRPRTDSAYQQPTLQIGTKVSALRDAPPIRPPSMSGWARSSGAFDAFIEPPYWIMTSSAVLRL